MTSLRDDLRSSNALLADNLRVLPVEHDRRLAEPDEVALGNILDGCWRDAHLLEASKAVRPDDVDALAQQLCVQ